VPTKHQLRTSAQSVPICILLFFNWPLIVFDSQITVSTIIATVVDGESQPGILAIRDTAIAAKHVRIPAFEVQHAVDIVEAFTAWLAIDFDRDQTG
jgi:hypothetical protein